MISPIKKILVLFFLMQSLYSFADENQNTPTLPIVIAVNQHLNQDNISQHGLNAIFKMRLHKWQDETPVTIFVLKDDHPLHKRFCKTILNVFPYQMRRSWDRLVFSGSGQAPIELKSKEEMIQKLLSTKGSIGYLTANDLQDGIKVLKIHSGRNN